MCMLELSFNFTSVILRVAILYLYRQVSCDDHVINDAIGSLCESGVINYFGMQRFGTSTVPTYQIGM